MVPQPFSLQLRGLTNYGMKIQIEATPKKSFEASETRGGRCMCYKKGR
jgi:hypothetical protein